MTSSVYWRIMKGHTQVISTDLSDVGLIGQGKGVMDA